jgi:trehalose utilization protein
MPASPIRVTVWGEYVHEHENKRVSSIYPQGMHETIAEGIREHLGDAASVRTATLDQPEHGLTENVLANTDVLTWWGHKAHARVGDAVVERVQARVLSGMGLLVLHSGHESKIFKRLMGTMCSLRWRESDDREAVWCVNPGHPIAQGIPEVFVIPQGETYSEYFDIPQPDELVFLSTYSGGEVFRSGCCFTRGAGKIFYFGPGHETYPIYHGAEVRQIIANGVRWASTGAGRRSTPFHSQNSPTGWFERNPNDRR